MAGGIVVFLAILGGAVFAAAVLRRRMAETIPLSVVALIAHSWLCGQIGLLKFSMVATALAFILLGVMGLYLSLRKKNPRKIAWDATPVLFALGFAWILYISSGRIPLEQADFTQWALAPKAMFFFNSLTPAYGALPQSPALAVFQTVFQACNAWLAPAEGFQDWLLYAACGTACLALLLPFARCEHPRAWVRSAYSLLFFLAVLCVPLLSFSLFSELNPDGFLAILAAAAFLQAARKPSPANAIVTGLYLFVLTLAKDAGLYFALAALLPYAVVLLRSEAYTQSKRARRVCLLAVPAAAILLARLSWPYLSFTLHGAAGVEVLRLFLQNFSAKLLTWRLGLTLGASTPFTLFTLHVSFLALTLILAGFTALLLRAMKAREPLRELKTTLIYASGAALLFVVGLWLSYEFAVDQADAAKLVNFQRLLSVGYVFWSLLIAAPAFQALSLATVWSWRRHALAVLTCLCVALMGSGALSDLTSRNFLPANDRYHTYFSVADEAVNGIPEDARVYVVSQSDDGTGFNTLRYALCPRQTNPENTCWLADPAAKPNDWAYSVTPESWKAELAEYDYVLVYRADDYLQTSIAAALTADGSIAANTLYRVDRETGLLEAVAPAE